MDLLKVKKNRVTRGVGNKHFLFYGDPGTRKTSVAALFPDSIILATEIGYRQIPDATAVDIDSWATFLQAINELKKPEVKEIYKTVIIDTVSILSDLCVQYICNVNGIKALDELGYGKGWTKYKQDFNRAINTIAQNGYAIVFIAHAETKKDADGNVVSIEPRIDRRPREQIEALTDFIFYVQKEKVGDRETVIAYSNLPQNVMTKSRIRGLAPSFEFTFDNVEREINKALDNYGAVYNGAEVGEEIHGKDVAKEEVPFEKIRDDTVELAKHYIEEGSIYKEKATEIIMNAMGGVRLSEAPQSYRQVLLDLQQELHSLGA